MTVFLGCILPNRMFELDEAKRIDVKTIKMHPWFNMPMRPELETATAKLEADQILVERKVASGAYHSKRRDQVWG